jgi:phospholipid/cholesterol/gamma-HCH transport system substrate-binding protein
VSLAQRVRGLRALRAGAAAASAAVLLTACQGAYDLPLPGGAAGGSDVYRVSIEFADVMDLVPQSAVRVNDVTVGSVESIDLDGWTAVVLVRLENSVELPDNAVAELRQTSLLGEKFVSLKAPADGARVGRLSDGDLIPLQRSGRNPEVEEVLGALSLLLNGGGVAQLQTINRELNNALEGREPDVRGVLEELDTFVGGLDQQKGEIVRALEGLDRLAATLAEQKDDIAYTLDQMPQALGTLEENRALLTQMLTALSELGVVATRVIDASQADTVANLQALQPILTRLNEAGEALPASLELLFTYPFNDSSVNAMRGDYTNLYLTLDADLTAVENLHPPGEEPPPETPQPPRVLSLPDPCALVDGALPVGCPPGAGPVSPGVPGTGQSGTGQSQNDLQRLLTGGVLP